jgi:diguanylate cyclase (GGDEF)-like protein/PAS domain S-box-containing protein
MVLMVTDQAQKPESPSGDGAAERSLATGLGGSILDTAHEAFISIDTAGSIIEWNRQAERTFGFSRHEVVGRELAATIVPERYRQSHRDGLQRFLSTGDGPVLGKRMELSAMHREGHEFPIEITIAPAGVYADTGDQVTFHAFMHDISERKLAEQVLWAMQAITHSMARADSPQQAMDALLAKLGTDMAWDIGAYWAVSEDGALERTASWTAAGVEATEFEAAGRDLRLTMGVGLPGRAWERGEPVWMADYTAQQSSPRVDAAQLGGLHAAICVPVLRGGTILGVIEFLTSESRVRDRAATDALAAVGNQIGELLGGLEHRQALVRSLEQLALTDELTGLPNRRAWEDGLNRELARAAREGHPVCVAMIDLDDFKGFNDERGHLAGDALLAETAAAWNAELRASDLLARYGGEEFAAVIPAWPIDAAVAVIDRMRAVTPAGLTCSAGVASWNRTETSMELFGRADAALYEAKHTGRNRTVAAG